MKLGAHLFRVIAVKGANTFSDLKGRTVARWNGPAFFGLRFKKVVADRIRA